MATITARLSPSDHGRPMTLDEFLDAEVEPGHRYELARGVLEVTKVPNDPHGQVVSNLYRDLFTYDHARPGRILRVGGGSEFQLILPTLTSSRNPDLAVVLRGSPTDFRGRRVVTLVAEVVSPGSIDRDYRVKREEYLAHGIREYWIVDLAGRKLTLLARDGDAWVERILQGDDPIASLVLPGLATTVADLWADLDEYEPSSD